MSKVTLKPRFVLSTQGIVNSNHYAAYNKYSLCGLSINWNSLVHDSQMSARLYNEKEILGRKKVCLAKAGSLSVDGILHILWVSDKKESVIITHTDKNVFDYPTPYDRINDPAWYDYTAINLELTNHHKQQLRQATYQVLDWLEKHYEASTLLRLYSGLAGKEATKYLSSLTLDQEESLELLENDFTWPYKEGLILVTNQLELSL